MKNLPLLLHAPVTSLSDLPDELMGTPIDRIELLPHLGNWAFITGQAMKYSAIPSAAKEAIRAASGINTFKSFVLIKDVSIEISDNKLEPQQREKISLDHLWVYLKEGQHLRMYDTNIFFGQIVIYQRTNGSLSLGTICMPACSYNLSRGLAQVDRYTEDGFFADMDCLTRKGLGMYSVPERARIINQLCDDALLMVKEGTLHLVFETAATFSDGMRSCWRSEWMILAGVKGTVNRAGRRTTNPRTKITSGQRSLKAVGLPPLHKTKSVKGFA